MFNVSFITMSLELEYPAQIKIHDSRFKNLDLSINSRIFTAFLQTDTSLN